MRLLSLPIFILYDIAILSYANNEYSNRRQACTDDWLLKTDDNALLFLASLLSPLSSDTFFTKYHEKIPGIIQNRRAGYYNQLIDLNVIADYLLSKRQPVDHTQTTNTSSPMIQHGVGVGWRLVKRVLRDKEWWSSSPNQSVIPLSTVYSSFEHHGYSIVIDKIQEFHPPLQQVVVLLGSIFGCKVNANVYLTPQGSNQAFESHFDWMDALIVQVIGCKSWKVGAFQSSNMPLPDTVFKISDNGRENSSANNTNSNSSIESGYNEFNLMAGSLLYMPRGRSHEAKTLCSCNSQSENNNDSNISNSKEIPATQEDEINSITNDTNNIPSLHVTFGLEAATHSTLEVFLHHYISTYFATKNISNSSAPIFSDRLELPTDTDRKNNDMKILFSLTSYSIVMTIPIEMNQISIENIMHLILHVAATIKSGKMDVGFSATNDTKMAINTTTGATVKTINANAKYGLFDGAILRQAVAVTTFISSNRYQPIMYEVLPDVVESLKILLLAYEKEYFIVRSIVLAVQLGLININIENVHPDSRNNDKNSNNDKEGRQSEKDAIFKIKKEKMEYENDASANSLNSGDFCTTRNRHENKGGEINLDPSHPPNYIKQFFTSYIDIPLLSILVPNDTDKNCCNSNASCLGKKGMIGLLISNHWDFSMSLLPSTPTTILPSTPLDKSLEMLIVAKINDILESLADKKRVINKEIKKKKGDNSENRKKKKRKLSDELYCSAWKSMVNEYTFLYSL